MQAHTIDPGQVPVFVLCGGQGTRFREQTELRPKPMIAVGKHPILWHIMNSYARHGFKRFVLCLGYRAEVIKAYFVNYHAMNSDFTVDLQTSDVQVHSVDHDQDWQVTLADTGELTMTGGRIARAAAKYLGRAEHFAVTYGDGLTDADLADEFGQHLGQGKVGTLLGINPPSRFGEIKVNGDEVEAFTEKPDLSENWVNGGYFFFRHDFLNYLDGDCVLEREPLGNLAADGQLNVYKHAGFWSCMDTQRDHDYLSRIWANGNAPWLKTHVAAGQAATTAGGRLRNR